MGVENWSTTAIDNATADLPDINWREGQSPGSVNNSARALMAAIAAYRDAFFAGTGTYTSSANYGGTDAATIAKFLMGSTGSPSASIDAAVIAQKHSSGAHTTAGSVNATIYASIFKNSTTSLARATAVYGEAQDQVGGSGSFVEGGRFHGTVMDTGGAGYGAVAVAGCDTNVAWDYLIALEGWVQNNTAVDQLTHAFFDKDNFAAGVIATGEGTAKSDAGFLTNPYSAEPFRTGFLVAEDSVDDTAFASRAATVVGLDLSRGSQSYAAIIIPNNIAIRARNAANSADLNVLAVDASNVLLLGYEAASISITPAVAAADIDSVLLAVNGEDIGGAWTTTTPTVAATSGTFTSASAAGAFKKIGKTCFWRARITITTNGTAAGAIVLDLPTIATGAAGNVNGIGVAATANIPVWFRGEGTAPTQVYIYKMDGSYPGADGEFIVVSGVYNCG